MAVPKRKLSKSRIRRRKRSHTHDYPATRACDNCGAPALPHRVCPSCGTYKGRQVLTVTGDE